MHWHETVRSARRRECLVTLREKTRISIVGDRTLPTRNTSWRGELLTDTFPSPKTTISSITHTNDQSKTPSPSVGSFSQRFRNAEDDSSKLSFLALKKCKIKLRFKTTLRLVPNYTLPLTSPSSLPPTGLPDVETARVTELVFTASREPSWLTSPSAFPPCLSLPSMSCVGKGEPVA